MDGTVQTVLCLILGYFMGCINPAGLVAKRHDVNLKEEGTGNLGATNTALVLGRKAGYFVLFFDIFKSFFSYRLARALFPHLAVVGVAACFGVILGHAFPVFNGFQGGKGLASFGGLVLAHDPLQFIILLMLGIVAAFVMNYGVYLAVTTTVLFPFFSWFRSGSMPVFLSTAAASGLVLALHWGNLQRAITGEDPIHTRDGFRKIFGKNV